MRAFGWMTMLWLLTNSAVSMAESSTMLPYGTTVRVQSAELLPGWHVGKFETTREGCAMVWISASEVPGGRKGLGLIFLMKLERQQGSDWIEVPIKSLIDKEPASCQNGAG